MTKDYPVERRRALEEFLRKEVGIQNWRIVHLIKCKAIRVKRDGSSLPLKGPDTRLQDGDTVQVDDPLPADCTKALEAVPAAEYRDYALVPGKTSFDKEMSGVMDNRPQTIRLQGVLVNSLADFIGALKDNTAVTNPIRHLVVASHANPEGYLFIQLAMMTAGVITYEDLEAAVKDKGLLIDSRLLEPRPKDDSGTPVAAAFLFRGCRIGSTLPYLKKLKEALGGTLTVIAPKHFHIAAHYAKPPAFVEYMRYNFPINRSKAFRNPGEAVKAFTAAGFTLIDGQPVPEKRWPQWIPKKDFGKTGDKNVPAKILSPITKAKDWIPGMFRYRKRRLLASDGSFALMKDPGTEAGRKKAVRDELVKNLARYQDTHPFPEYVRYGYKTMDEFMDGWTWTFKYEVSNHTLFYNATRHEYVVSQPIVEPAKNTLILNYYPSGKAQKTTKPLELLDSGDTRFFATV